MTLPFQGQPPDEAKPTENSMAALSRACPPSQLWPPRDQPGKRLGVLPPDCLSNLIADLLALRTNSPSIDQSVNAGYNYQYLDLDVNRLRRVSRTR
jgi:hypothetical protein